MSPHHQKKKGLTLVEQDQVKECFDLFDMDGSGSIDFSELTTAMKALGFEPTEEEVNEIIKQADDDVGLEEGAYAVEYDEFLLLMTKKICEHDAEDDMRKAFQLFDLDKSGKVTMANIKAMAAEAGDDSLTDEELKDIVEVASQGGSEIAIEDFVRVMKSQGLC